MKNIVALSLISLFLTAQGCQSSNHNQSSAVDSLSQSDHEDNIDDGHNSQNSLDWAGSYEGTIPCADCPGIKTTIILKKDDSFTYRAEYLERSNSSLDSGKFMWHDNGRSVHLIGKDINTKYKVAENRLILLDQEGKPMTGSNAELYNLIKIN